MPYLDDGTWQDESDTEGEKDEFDQFLEEHKDDIGKATSSGPDYGSMSDEEFLRALDGDSYEATMRGQRAQLAAEERAAHGEYDPDALGAMSEADFNRMLAGVPYRGL